MYSPNNAFLDESHHPTVSYFSNSSSCLSTSLENQNVTHSYGANPSRSLSSSSTTLTIRPPPSGSHVKRNGEQSPTQYTSPKLMANGRSPPPPPLSLQQQQHQHHRRPSSPLASPSIHKSLSALDAKAITRDIERSMLYSRDDVMSPASPTSNPHGYLSNNYTSTSTINPMSTFQSISSVSTPHYPYPRQNSTSSMITLPPPANMNNSHPDAWQALCVRVLPLFNGEGVQGTIEDLNELLQRCITDPIMPQLYHDIEALLRDGMFTLNAKMFGVTDEKLLDRLVEQWSFFFTYALPYFEAVFLPLRTDVRYRSQDEAEMWDMRTMALRSFRDNVILLQTKRLEDVFNKLFTDFGSSQNPAATAAKMLQMTSLLASSPDHNEEIERVLSNLKANWKIMMTKGDRRGFAGIKKVRPLNA
ncbi:HbrB-like-domain-containing protein [Blakeslea trispora]|nr:HbrB-like-domain-containing protein [Blakeslea trispora]